MERLIKYFGGFPNILLIGFGREGRSSFQLIRTFFPEKKIAIADRNEKILEEVPGLKQDQHLTIFSGLDYLKAVSDYEMVIKSPGVKLGREQKGAIKNLTSQTDIFLKFYGAQCIGITGTKGKSTTSSIIAHVLKMETGNAFLIGNIGKPPFDYIQRISPDTRMIFELSSHQLLDVKHSPHIAVLLNLYNEHLDFYESPEEYFRAKFNIFKYQGTADFAIINGDDMKIPQFLGGLDMKASLFEFSQKSILDAGCYQEGELICFTGKADQEFCIPKDMNKNLIGKHNLNNLMAALSASLLSGADKELLKEAIASFKGLPHRLEYLGKYQNIHFYNDSIATIPEACIAALDSLVETDSLILGGFDRNLNYIELARYLAKSRVSNFIFTGPAGRRMKQLLEKNCPAGRKLYLAEDMHDAVRFAAINTSPGKICLLSPAAASYDQYKNFEERGDAFKKEAERL